MRPDLKYSRITLHGLALQFGGFSIVTNVITDPIKSLVATKEVYHTVSNGVDISHGLSYFPITADIKIGNAHAESL